MYLLGCLPGGKNARGLWLVAAVFPRESCVVGWCGATAAARLGLMSSQPVELADFLAHQIGPNFKIAE